jgi:hypothetical protein
MLQPFLGVSSLDLGRSLPWAASFCSGGDQQSSDMSPESPRTEDLPVKDLFTKDLRALSHPLPVPSGGHPRLLDACLLRSGEAHAQESAMWWLWVDWWLPPSRCHEVISVDFKRRRVLDRTVSVR